MLMRDKDYYRLAGIFGIGAVCAFSRRPQNMSLDYGDTRDTLRNREDFLSRLGIDYQSLVCAEQAHGSKIRYAQEEDKGKGALSHQAAIASTDAPITDKKNLPLAIFSADCLSIFLYDPIKSAIGLIHAGWQGTKKNITTHTLQLMEENFASEAQDLHVALGPAIRGCCYEVGQEFSRLFPREFLVKRTGRCYLDLVGVNKKQLLDSGVKEQNIFDTCICTSCQNEEFFSFRREGHSCARTMSVIMLR